jgi:uncharacterized protein with HEPN domain
MIPSPGSPSGPNQRPVARNERLYLADIVEAADRIAAFLADCDRPRFDGSDLVQCAVFRELTIVGEAASHASPELRSKYPDVPWSVVVSFRHLIHSYFEVDWDFVWESATRNAPELRAQIAAILADYPDAD